MQYALLPLVLAAGGIVASLIGTFLVRTREGGNPQTALNTGTFVAAGVMLAVTYFIAHAMLPGQYVLDGVSFGANGVVLATIAGLVAGVAIGLITEHYTSEAKKPAREERQR